MTFLEDLEYRAGRSDEEHDSAQRLVARLKRMGLDRSLLKKSADEVIRSSPTMDTSGRPRNPRIVVSPLVKKYGWAGPPPWDPKKWAADRAALRGEG